MNNLVGYKLTNSKVFIKEIIKFIQVLMKIQFGFNDSDQLFETNIKEHVIWKNEIVIGDVSQKVIETQIITNLRVLQNNSYYFLHTLDNVMVMNQHVESQHRHKIHSQKSLNSHRNYTKTTVGDVVFVYRGKPVIAFAQIIDPISLSKLAKNARLSLISLLKTVKGNTTSRVTKKRIEKFGVSNSYPVNRTHNRSLVSSELKCTKCGVPIVKDSNFCNSCGYKVSFLCLGCNHENPSGSSFCNNCGLALT